MSSSAPDAWFDGLRDGLRAHERDRGAGTPSPTRYEVREKIGEGGSGIVYRAWDRQLRRHVALKVLRDSAALSRTLRARFMREATTAAGLVHPNLVAVYEAAEAQGNLYLVMELVEGSSLATILAQGALPPREKIVLLEKAARGVAAAHVHGIIHRDLKPGNILVSASGDPKVGDFGLALETQPGTRLTQTGGVVGTPSYMAPEQVRGSAEISLRADVYALGAILYEILTGRRPHEAGSVLGLYAEIVERDPVPPRKLDPVVSREVEAICLKALEKDPRDRYADAGAFADELRRFLSGQAIQAGASRGAARAWRRFKRRPVAAAGLILALALALVSAALFSTRGRSDPEAARTRLERELGRALAAEVDRVRGRFKSLPPVRLVAALEAATDAASPSEIQEVLDYELRKLRLEQEFFALVDRGGKTIYLNGREKLVRALRGVPLAGDGILAADGDGLWWLVSEPVRETSPEKSDSVRGARWVAVGVDAPWLQHLFEAGLGRVAWKDRQGAIVAGSLGGPSEHEFSREVHAVPAPLRLHLWIPEAPFWDALRRSASVLALLALGLAAAVRRGASRRREGPPVIRVSNAPPPERLSTPTP